MMRTRTASREGPVAPTKAQLPSFEFERGGSAEVRRSASHNGHRRVVATHGHSNSNGHANANSHTNHRPRGHAHSNSLDMRTRALGHGHSNSHRHTRTRSPPNNTHPARSHTHPQPSQQRGATSPHAALHSPPAQNGRQGGASATSQSTAGTAATNTTTGAAAAGGTGSWGRVARTVDWVRGAGVHPPFAFESAASSTASANGERRAAAAAAAGGSGGGGPDIRERERDKDRERSRRQVAQVPAAPVPVPGSPGKSTGSSTAGHWERREVELGLGLTWAPSKIRVREWTPGGTIPVLAAGAQFAAPDDEARAQREMELRVLEREGARRTRERLAEYEMGYVRSRSRSRKDKEVTGRFREVLGAEGFEAFKKCEFHLELAPLVRAR